MHRIVRVVRYAGIVTLRQAAVGFVAAAREATNGVAEPPLKTRAAQRVVKNRDFRMPAA